MVESAWLRHDAATGRYSLTVHVQPGARRSAIAGLYGDALKVRVAAQAVENRANAELIAFLAESLGLDRGAITIRRGAAGRRKTVELRGGPELAARLNALVEREAAVNRR